MCFGLDKTNGLLPKFEPGYHNMFDRNKVEQDFNVVGIVLLL